MNRASNRLEPGLSTIEESGRCLHRLTIHLDWFLQNEFPLFLKITDEIKAETMPAECQR